MKQRGHAACKKTTWKRLERIQATLLAVLIWADDTNVPIMNESERSANAAYEAITHAIVLKGQQEHIRGNLL